MHVQAGKDTVLVVGLGSFHARFVAENQASFPGITWVWAHAPASVWDEENRRARENESYLQALGMRSFDPSLDADRLLGIMVLTGDGRWRAEEYKKWSCFGCPIYLDKPFCTCLEEWAALQKCAEQCRIPWSTGSSMRFYKGWQALVRACGEGLDRIQLQAPWPLRSGREGWCWYGVHAIELLAHAVNSPLAAVQVQETGGGRILEAQFASGQIGEIRSSDSFSELRLSVERAGEVETHCFRSEAPLLYRNLLEAVLGFFESKRRWQRPLELENTAKLLHFGWESQQTKGLKWNTGFIEYGY